MHLFIKLTAHITWKYWKKMTNTMTREYINKYILLLYYEIISPQSLHCEIYITNECVY